MLGYNMMHFQNIVRSVIYKDNELGFRKLNPNLRNYYREEETKGIRKKVQMFQ